MTSLNLTLPTYPPTLETVVGPRDTNPQGDLFGGWMMAQMDLAGGARAFAYAGCRVVTAGVSDLSFLKPVFAGYCVRFYTSIVHTGRTSVGVQIDVWARSGFDAAFEPVTSGRYTFVAVDRNFRPVPLPDTQIVAA